MSSPTEIALKINSFFNWAKVYLPREKQPFDSLQMDNHTTFKVCYKRHVTTRKLNKDINISQDEQLNFCTKHFALNLWKMCTYAELTIYNLL